MGIGLSFIAIQIDETVPGIDGLVLLIPPLTTRDDRFSIIIIEYIVAEAIGHWHKFLLKIKVKSMNDPLSFIIYPFALVCEAIYSQRVKQHCYNQQHIVKNSVLSDCFSRCG